MVSQTCPAITSQGLIATIAREPSIIQGKGLGKSSKSYEERDLEIKKNTKKKKKNTVDTTDL